MAIMRRFVLIAGLAGTLSGCQLRDVFSAKADVAAEAGEAELSSERLGAILAGPKNLRPDRQAAEFIAGLWIDYALLAQAVATGDTLTDSATVAEAMWPELAELRGIHWHDTLVARRGSLTAGAADSAYAGDEMRIFQHILFRVAQTATPEEREAARRQANATLSELRGGADFGELARNRSADGSAADGGYLPPSPRGAFVPAFDSAGWALAPGATSGLVETPFGYHIIRRPGLDSVRERIEQHLVRLAGSQLDSVYMDSLATASRLEISDDAVSAIRAAVQSPREHLGSTRKVATYEGGALTVGELVRWVQVLPPQYQQQIRDAGDEDLKGFARVLAQNLLLLREAERNDIQVTPEEWQTIRERYAMVLDSVRAEIGFGDEVTDPSVPEAQRVQTALLNVDQYFDRLIAGDSRLVPLPGALGPVLRGRTEADINDAGLSRGVQYAERLRGDSAGTTGAPLRRAPGGAPIMPGATANDAAGQTNSQPSAPPAQPTTPAP
jgi:hypothetical protein